MNELLSQDEIDILIEQLFKEMEESKDNKEQEQEQKQPV